MHNRLISFAMLLLLATGCTETYNPQPTVSSTAASNTFPQVDIPECNPGLELDGFSIIVDTLRRNGEVQRFQSYFHQLRTKLDGRLAKLDSGARDRARRALDEAFAAGQIERLALCAFARFDRMQPAFEAWEAWSLDPKMRDIHAAIVDPSAIDGGLKEARQVADARRQQLLRVARAVDLRSYLHAMLVLNWKLVAIVEAAIDPESSLAQDLAMNGGDLGVPPEEVLVDRFLAKALENASDVELEHFLEFAESREGRAYYETLRERYFMQADPWTQGLTTVLNSIAVPAAIVKSPEEAHHLFTEARRLLDQVGTRVVIPDARTLLLRAERLDPDNAEIQVLLARVAFYSLPPAYFEDEDQLRPLNDRMHPADPQRYADVEKYLRRALEIDPKNAEAHLYLGRVQFMLSHDDEAARLYTQSRQLDPKVPELAYFEADLAYVTGDYAMAERIHRQILAAPEARAFDHHYSLDRLRRVLIKRGREHEFRQIAKEQLERHPDMWDFRLQQAHRLVATDGTVSEVEALIAPVPESWLPDAKRMVQVHLQLLRAAEATPANRAGEVQRAFELAESATEVLDALCRSRARRIVAGEAVAASGEPKAASDRLLACALGSHDIEFIDAVLPTVKDIDQPNASMLGERPLCNAVGLMDPKQFSALLKVKPDVAKPCTDGKTVRESLALYATQANIDPSTRKAAKDMLELLDRHVHAH